MKKITFKSTPENWFKEDRDIKRNTVRYFTESNDIREEILESFINSHFDLYLEIVNTVSQDITLKKVTDVTMIKCECKKRIYIISW